MELITRKEAIEKGLSKFFVGKQCLNGHIAEREVSSYQCLECKKERTKIGQRKRRAENPEYARVASRISRNKHKEKYNASRRAVYASNPSKFKDRERMRYLENTEAKKAAAERYRNSNREKVKAINRAYYWADPERRKASAHRIRAERAKANGTHTSADIQSIRQMQKNKCGVCRQKLGKFHIDHIIPLSKGGSNDKSNIQILCPNCNMKKSNKHPIDFMQQNGFLL